MCDVSLCFFPLLFLVFELVLNSILSRFLKYFHFHHGCNNKFAACPTWQQQSLREQVLNLTLCYKVCHFYLLEIFVILGFGGDAFCFDFAKCNMKADAAALVSYADLVKKKKNYIYCLFFMLLWNFFLKLLCSLSIVRI